MTDTNQLSRKEREEAFRRSLVLDIAESLFAEKGFDGTTVSEIAERSELAKGSLYQLFQSKEEMIAAIIKRKVDQIWPTLEVIFVRDSSPREKIRSVIEVKLRMVWQSRHFARIFLHELRGFHWFMESPLLDGIKEDMRALRIKIEDLLAEGQRLGEFRDDLPTSTLMAAMAGFSNAIMHSWLSTGEDIDLETALNQAEELFLYGICAREEAD